MLTHRPLRFAAQLALLLGPALCLEQSRHHVKRDVGSIDAEYDYIVVGGGTSGLVVASRLSEDPKSKIPPPSCPQAPENEH